jgi:hypothetical protein
MRCESCEELREKLSHMAESTKRLAMDLDGYEGGAPAKGTRIWRCEKELTKARANIAELRALLEKAVRWVPWGAEDEARLDALGVDGKVKR